MEIIIEGYKVDTLNIWDVELIENTREVWVVVKITDKPNINIGRTIPYETYQHEYAEIWKPFRKLYKSIKEKWEADKSETPVFKL